MVMVVVVVGLDSPGPACVRPPSAGPPTPPPDRPKFRFFFPSPALIFRYFSLSLGVFSWNFGGVFEGRDPLMSTFGVLGPPGFHTRGTAWCRLCTERVHRECSTGYCNFHCTSRLYGHHAPPGNCHSAVPMRATTPFTQRAALEEMQWTLLRSPTLLN